MISPGEPAPDIDAPSTQVWFALRERLTYGPVVLYFFPIADTPG